MNQILLNACSPDPNLRNPASNYLEELRLKNPDECIKQLITTVITESNQTVFFLLFNNYSDIFLFLASRICSCFS